ncbi:MAG: hypothetical protein A3G33_04700 [Omnitrophica bacterium RIFCSPLOWO2_12_FULL_44_17]|uniref:DUF3047 domain-containing protein n=1 Tax=Candidatus Danuiimicrobium aquiferis TaxID=1801832 RepID=A0A1G1KQN3_9BACT|nr:MAG: hypothetical protein A3B72_10910 [Omnitrophica bacterium RIFCSPHIGHO2_02_FULL_45_28]OGW89386.1 MAG: hypothetical protein A3E74_02535 [Omnitrophica bacterium RIFCSPHIGHO2_12_FULL_44_12]OGW95233.1 MAG: hypothetical protein A3G33_04700 [Omnitrophica bacterium RIFCSPLOWO2_12_FULL_44_17]OGX02329.1 MAG: hypothetical protein A3J12_10025 [Omnitrophica bacterium RIFCSPLOWO2_02_FULL_44_11]
MLKRRILIIFLVLCIAVFFFYILWSYGLILKPKSVPKNGASLMATGQLSRIDFNQPDELKNWKEYKSSGSTTYEIKPNPEGEMVLYAESHGKSSALCKEMRVSVQSNPQLIWEWRALKFPTNKENKTFGASKDSDYAGRVYVMFDGLNPLFSEIIQYIWDDHFPEGTQTSSPYTKRVKLLVVRSGPSSEWKTEKRDIVSDYKMLYGKTPKSNIRGIAVMTDSDDTGTDSALEVRYIGIEKSMEYLTKEAETEEKRKHKFDFLMKIVDTVKDIKLPKIEIPAASKISLPANPFKGLFRSKHTTQTELSSPRLPEPSES